MTTEVRTITIPGYRDDDGEPCCARDFGTGAVCELYRSAKFGTHESCAWTLEKLFRRKQGVGTLIPCQDCPIWP